MKNYSKWNFHHQFRLELCFCLNYWNNEQLIVQLWKSFDYFQFLNSYWFQKQLLPDNNYYPNWILSEMPYWNETIYYYDTNMHGLTILLIITCIILPLIWRHNCQQKIYRIWNSMIIIGYFHFWNSEIWYFHLIIFHFLPLPIKYIYLNINLFIIWKSVIKLFNKGHLVKIKSPTRLYIKSIL